MMPDAASRRSRPIRRRAVVGALATLLLAAGVPAPLAARAGQPPPPVRHRGLGAVTDATPPGSHPRAVAPVGGRVLRRFQRPPTPYGSGHRGVDLAAEPGEQVRAALAGTIAFAGLVGGVPWVTVAHDDGLDTTYGGLEPAVAVGEAVPMGGVLGRAGSTGRLDWGARHGGRYVDPLGLLGGWRVRLVPIDAGS